ncbi:BET1 homolog [Lingula anatina]|uniref:BET1 homolog n=1 Tax=Lingula anatina TaxID=7574 RepID=A0A1S3J9D5_LINAN|nr:BET1 homolog [Lingula anatina]XP_013407015.1 BET1 homolog [Lingula anatina]|eukprot:XP_013407003.1 BET1 homolog [Lingula anatina]
MRRAHAGDGSYGQSQMIEEENDSLTNSLSDKVKALKSLTIDIGTEVREQNKFLNDFDNDMDNSSGILGATMGRLTAMARAGHNKFIWYLLLFSLFVFFVLWLIIKTR